MEHKKTMAQKNNFPENFITNLTVQMKQKIHQTQDKDENKKWATFTYYSPKIRKLTKLFKHTNINIALKTQTQYSNIQNQRRLIKTRTKT